MSKKFKSSKDAAQAIFAALPDQKKFRDTIKDLEYFFNTEFRNENSTPQEQTPQSSQTVVHLYSCDDFFDDIQLESPQKYKEDLAEKLTKIRTMKNLVQQKRIAYDRITKRGTSKLDRKAGDMVNGTVKMPLDIPKTAPMESSEDALYIRWNAPYNAQGEQLRVTPFDQEIETIISNFFDEGYPDVTTEQIYAALTGQSGHTTKQKRKSKIIEDIEQSIKKLNTIRVSIWRTKEKNKTVIIEDGEILDTRIKYGIIVQGQIRPFAWHINRLGALYATEKSLGRLRIIKQETLNLATSGITFTELSFTLRRFCLMEIARFRTTDSIRSVIINSPWIVCIYTKPPRNLLAYPLI